MGVIRYQAFSKIPKPLLSTRLSRSITGSLAFITGAASGIGRATAHLFCDEGAKVAIVDINRSALQDLAREITEAGGEAPPCGATPSLRKWLTSP
jgi:NAD(P)-dependent dehydrogenase (short-subunit alcohol dehydrogenase family)